jgi:hypothetical protein
MNFMLSLPSSYRPLSKQSVTAHICVAIGSLLLLSGVSYGVLKRNHYQLKISQDMLYTLREGINKNISNKEGNLSVLRSNFTQSLPSRTLSDEVIRDMGRHAQFLGLGLGTLVVVHHVATDNQWGRVQLTATTACEYSKCKTFLAELLARYPHLAVQTLSVRPTNNASLQDWQLVLSLYVKD